MAWWGGDFEWGLTGVRVRKTGARVPFDAAHLSEIFHWCVYFCALMAASRPKGGPVVGFRPDPARPWYLIWPTLWLAGGRFARAGETPDLWMHFEDATVSQPTALPADGRPRWNFDAHDLSKSAVAAAFARAFGRTLALDPLRDVGLAVEKGEANGVHDGRIVTLPRAPVPGKVHQRLIDNRAPDGLFEDLRTPTVAGRPVCVFVKRRGEAARFSNDNVSCHLRRVEDMFSGEEIAMIERFCADLRLDWGGLDILRDARDGSLAIVDANRTDMGPPIALPLADKLRATRALADAFARAVKVAVATPKEKARA
jgi:hypothetical protein